MSWVYRRPPDFRSKPSRLFLLLYAASAITGSADSAFATTGTLTGSGALAGVASLSFSNSATPVPDNLIGTASLVLDASATIQGAGALAGAAAQTFATSGAPSFSTAFDVVLFKQKRRQWREQQFDYSRYNRLTIFPLSTESTISGQCDVSFGATSGTLVGIAATSGAVSLTTAVSGSLLGSGSLAGSSAVTFTVEGTAIGTPSGSIAGIAASIITPTATLGGIGRLEGAASSIFTCSLIQGSIVQVFGVADFAISVSGALVASSFQTEPRLNRTVRMTRPKRIQRMRA